MHKARDAQGNEAVGTSITQSTAAGIAFDTASGGDSQGVHNLAINLSAATVGSMALVYVYRNVTAEPILVPTGWEEVAPPVASGIYKIWCWRKLLTTDDIATSPVWQWTPTANRTTWQVATYRGVSAVGNVSSALSGSAGSNQIPIGSFTTSAQWIVGFASGINGMNPLEIVAPSGYVRRSYAGSVDVRVWSAVFDTAGTHSGTSVSPIANAVPYGVNYRGGFVLSLI